MTIGSILLGIALFLLVGLFVARPLMQRQTRLGYGRTRRRQATRQNLVDQKEAILTQIRSLDFDHETGKISEDDYQRQRSEFMAEATAILKQLDELDAVAEAAESSGPIQEADEQPNAIDADIEAAISRLRRESAAGVPIATRGSNGETRYCPQCGQPADAGDKFCAHCGHRLLQPQQA